MDESNSVVVGISTLLVTESNSKNKNPQLELRMIVGTIRPPLTQNLSIVGDVKNVYLLYIIHVFNRIETPIRDMGTDATRATKYIPLA